MKNTLKDILKAIEEVISSLLSFIYRWREFFILWIMSSSNIAFCWTVEQIHSIIILVLILVFVCIALRYWHKVYQRSYYQIGEKKRFVVLDDNGNPSVRIEDLPEIVEYLYRLEVEESGK